MKIAATGPTYCQQIREFATPLAANNAAGWMAIWKIRLIGITGRFHISSRRLAAFLAPSDCHSATVRGFYYAQPRANARCVLRPKTLRVTPAMEVGVSDHAWSLALS